MEGRVPVDDRLRDLAADHEGVADGGELRLAVERHHLRGGGGGRGGRLDKVVEVVIAVAAVKSIAVCNTP